MIFLYTGSSTKTALESSTCKDTAQELEDGTSWILTSPKDDHYPHTCKWTFVISAGESLVVNTVKNYHDLRNITHPCLEYEDGNNMVHQIFNKDQEDQTWCFQESLKIIFFVIRCPPPDPWHSLISLSDMSFVLIYANIL